MPRCIDEKLVSNTRRNISTGKRRIKCETNVNDEEF